MKYPQNIREEELKNKIAQNFFEKFDATEIIKDIDFAVKLRRPENALDFAEEYLLWAEAKTGCPDIFASFVQLILTIGQSGTVGNRLPPAFLGAFNTQKIAFIPYIDIADVFQINDFNWKVTPSNHESKEFRLLYDRVKSTIEQRMYLFDYEKEEVNIRHFIKNNLPAGQVGNKIRITKNNFIHIYLRWVEEVKPYINFNWEGGKKAGILDCDFYRADLFVDDKNTDCIDDDTAINNKLSVVFRRSQYQIITKAWDSDVEVLVSFKQGGRERYISFWKKYKRPPLQEYWDYIIDRRDLLVPQDVRERKGSFFTPKIWVELSQKYIADVLGEDWQDEYYVWDCAAGTGNLLAGLTNKYNIWASTLDKADVDVMKDRIHNGANLLERHVFQFDFLNDDFTKLPQGLQEIINDPEKRKKLIVYINPPYAEASAYGKDSIPQVANSTKVFSNYRNVVGAEALNELFAQFFTRVYHEIPDSFLASFSTLKYITSGKFTKFRSYFRAEYKKGFICQSNTFDNVDGKFPIGFLIWNLANKQEVELIETDIFLNDKEIKSYWQEGTKNFYAFKNKSIADWRTTFYCSNENSIGYMIIVGPSMQSNNNTFITNYPAKGYVKKKMTAPITKENLINMSIYLAIRKVIPDEWYSDRDLFLFPNDGWKSDTEFQNDCLAFALFNNNIQSAYGANHWIPFTESEVDSRDKFDSRFMTDFIAGKIRQEQAADLFSDDEPETRKTPLVFSDEALAVFDAGRELWRYYHIQPECNVNASLYDIREHFQGRNEKGKMNNRSTDETYNELIGELRSGLRILAHKIEPKVYEYGFLKK